MCQCCVFVCCHGGLGFDREFYYFVCVSCHGVLTSVLVHRCRVLLFIIPILCVCKKI